MQIRKIQGLENLLASLSLEPEDGKVHHVVYPWHEYSKIQGQDVGFWYSAEGCCQYSTLRRCILETFERIGHPTTARLADALVLTFILMPTTGDRVGEFEKILACFSSADVSQFLLIPASTVVLVMQDDGVQERELIGFFEHGPFEYLPLAGDVMDKLKYRLRRMGFRMEMPELDKFYGCIAVCRATMPTQIIDFTRLGFKGVQPSNVVRLIQWYFDDLAQELFESFWHEHLGTQYWFVAAGADLLDRSSLESLPGTAWLSLFWGFDLPNGGNGTFSLITEESHYRGKTTLMVHEFQRALDQARSQLKLESEDLGKGPHKVYACLRNYARLIARSRELQSRSYLEESSTLSMVALESMLAESEQIAQNLSRRIGALLALAEDKPFEETVKNLRALYEARSRFVHQGDSIQPESLERLQRICQVVFFAAYRSQVRSTLASSEENIWKRKWVSAIDYMAASFDAGIAIDRSAVTMSGVRWQTGPGR